MDATPAASATPRPAPTLAPGDEPRRTPAASQPAIDAGRDDCPAGWLAFDAAAYSVCYPPDLYAELLSSPFFPTVLQIRLLPGGPGSAAPYTVALWASSPANNPDVESCAFEGEENAELDEQRVDETNLGHLDATTCTARLVTQTQYYGVARTPRGSVAFKSQAGSEEQLELAKQILATIVPVDIRE
jgi:hypothetical protein